MSSRIYTFKAMEIALHMQLQIHTRIYMYMYMKIQYTIHKDMQMRKFKQMLASDYQEEGAWQ